MLEGDCIYRGVVKDHRVDVSSGGKPYLELDIDLNGKLNDDKQVEDFPEEEEVNRKVKVWLSDNAMPTAEKALNTLGFEGTDLGRLHHSHEDPHSFEDKECYVKVSIGEWNGQEQENFFIYNFRPPKSDEEILEAFLQQSEKLKEVKEDKEFLNGEKEW